MALTPGATVGKHRAASWLVPRRAPATRSPELSEARPSHSNRPIFPSSLDLRCVAGDPNHQFKPRGFTGKLHSKLGFTGWQERRAGQGQVGNLLAEVVREIRFGAFAENVLASVR